MTQREGDTARREAYARIIAPEVFAAAELSAKWDVTDKAERAAKHPWWSPAMALRLQDISVVYDRVDAILAKEQQALGEALARVESLEAALADALAGWRYIRRNHGDLYGVGWDRVEQTAAELLTTGARP